MHCARYKQGNFVRINETNFNKNANELKIEKNIILNIFLFIKDANDVIKVLNLVSMLESIYIFFNYCGI